jgi:hypothetical protein
MNHKTLGFLCSAGVLSFLSGTAQAQVTAGALQLGLGTDVVTYSSGTGTVAYPTGDISQDVKTTRWGFADRSGVNVEGGYGIGDSLIVGGFVGLGGWSQKQQLNEANAVEEKQSTLNLTLAPKIDYMLLPGKSIRPFFGGAIGLAYSTDTRQTRTNNNVTRTDSDTSLTGLAIMLRAGVRCFLTPGFSIDPAFMFTWVPTASGSYTDLLARKYDMSADSYTLGLTVAASGWVGL